MVSSNLHDTLRDGRQQPAPDDKSSPETGGQTMVPRSGVAPHAEEDSRPPSSGRAMNASRRIPPPSAEVLRTLRPIERMHFGIARRMNGEPFKGFFTFLQRNIGATVIHGIVRRYTEVSGIEHLEAADHSRPILLLPNHRSYYDLYIVGSCLLYTS